jgi:hypothetical protein
VADLLQVLRGTSATISQTFSVDGATLDLDTGVPVVTVTRPDLTTIASGTVTHVGSVGSGKYQMVLVAQANETLLTITWTGTIGGQPQTLTSYVEVVGGFLFGLSAFRAMRVGGGTPFAATATPLYSDAQIQEARTEILDEFTEILGFSPVPRFARATLNGNGRTCLGLPGLMASRVLSVTVNGVAQTATNYQATDANEIEAISSYGPGAPFTSGRRNVVVEWVHGWDRVKGIGGTIAMIWAGAQLNPSGFSSASTISMPDGSTYTYEPSETGRGGFRRPSGIRQADRWFDLHSQPSSVGVA